MENKKKYTISLRLDETAVKHLEYITKTDKSKTIRKLIEEKYEEVKNNE